MQYILFGFKNFIPENIAKNAFSFPCKFLSRNTKKSRPKVHFGIFGKLKNQIQNFILRFCFQLNMKNEIQINDHYFRILRDFYFDFLILSFVFYFYKKWKTSYIPFFAFHFHERIEKQIT